MYRRYTHIPVNERDVQYAIVCFPWLAEVMYRTMYDETPLRDIVMMLLTTPTCYPLELKLELATMDISGFTNDPNGLITVTTIANQVIKSMDNANLPSDTYVFLRWIDHNTALMSSAKLLYDGF